MKEQKEKQTIGGLWNSQVYKKKRRVTHRDIEKRNMKKKTDISDRSRERERDRDKKKVLRHLEEETIIKKKKTVEILFCFLLLFNISHHSVYILN